MFKDDLEAMRNVPVPPGYSKQLWIARNRKGWEKVVLEDMEPHGDTLGPTFVSQMVVRDLAIYLNDSFFIGLTPPFSGIQHTLTCAL